MHYDAVFSVFFPLILGGLMKHYVYIIECQNGSYYTGYTTDVERRYHEHQNGIRCKYTRAFPPKKLAASWELENKSEAMRVEYKIKLLSKTQKEKLITTRDLLLLEV